MKIAHIRQVDRSELLQLNFDLIICASGYESRSSRHAKFLSSLCTSNKVYFGFQENKSEGARHNNDLIYNALNFQKYNFSGHSDVEAEQCLQKFLKETEKDTCNIIVDISSMTRSWYGGIIRTLASYNAMDKIRVFFVYTPAAFFKMPHSYPPNEIISPLKGFCGLGLPDKPVALIIGLGQDRGRAIGIKEALDPNIIYTFMANPGTDKRFYNEVLNANKDLLNYMKDEYKFDYPILDFISTYDMLENICIGLSKNWSVVLTSLGPKIFSLSCFLLAVQHPFLSVWRISAGSRGEVVDVKSSKKNIFIEVEWLKNSLHKSNGI